MHFVFVVSPPKSARSSSRIGRSYSALVVRHVELYGKILHVSVHSSRFFFVFVMRRSRRRHDGLEFLHAGERPISIYSFVCSFVKGLRPKMKEMTEI